ncbi:MAG: DUF305 domain-containing protein [Candidatus Pacebacteria bacterium]|nr:DUF305 domain-containing protein [Candidatus Paceibacterota bacterium]
MSKISTTLAIALIIVSGVLGVLIGSFTNPEYKANMYDKSEMDFGRADRTLDLRYLNAMISHHRGAMLLAEQAQNYSERPEIKELAEKILTNEPGAIDELYTWKKDWYKDTRKVKDPVVANLGAYDANYDLRFLNALIAHHEMGLLMTKDIKTKSSRLEVLNNADAVETFLKDTLEVFKNWRKDWYNI